MSEDKSQQAARVPHILAIVVLLSSQLLLAASTGRPAAKPAAAVPGSVAIVPFTFVGRVDDDLTGAFHERITALKTGTSIVDDAAFASHLGKGVNYRSDAPLGALLRAAKATKAELLILGQASSYKFMDAPGVSLRVRVIDVGTGGELHRNLSKETAWTLPGAKREAGDTAAKQVVKQWRAE